jgi:hypothetical protein
MNPLFVSRRRLRQGTARGKGVVEGGRGEQLAEGGGEGTIGVFARSHGERHVPKTSLRLVDTHLLCYGLLRIYVPHVFNRDTTSTLRDSCHNKIPSNLLTSSLSVLFLKFDLYRVIKSLRFHLKRWRKFWVKYFQSMVERLGEYT